MAALVHLLLATAGRAEARELAHALIPETSVVEELLRIPEPLQASCDRAARTPWAVAERLGGSLMTCELVPLRRHRLASVAILFAGGMRLYLARRHGPNIQLIHLLGVVEWHATETGNIRITRITESTARSGETLVAVETHSSFIDYEATDVHGLEARGLTLCAMPRGTRTVTRCDATAPLSFESWEGHARPSEFSIIDGSVTRYAYAEAIAVVRRDSRIRLTLRHGTWDTLFAWPGSLRPETLPTTPRMVLPARVASR